MDEDSFPHYRRRNNGKNFERPGHDVAAITFEPKTENIIIDHDEIHNYIETRYVGPVEASWRILGKKLQDKSHVVLRLPVHLPNEQNITIENECVEDVLFSVVDQVTMLIDYFALNLRDEEAKNYLYTEIPRYYTFKKIKINDKNVSRWTKRRATSFQNLKVVNGETHQTFPAACLALGLIEDDEEWNRAMNEAVKWMMPQQLRRLFSRILIHCNPLYPEKLWESFKDALSEDYVRNIEIDIFILDEAPMAPRYALEIMDRTLRDITDNNLPFGGKIIILGGDFRQLLPKTHSTRSEIVNLSIKFSSTWKYFEKFSLSQNMRVLSEEPEFANFLLDLGDGNLNDSNNNIQIPQCCIASPDTDIVADIYGDLIKKKDFLKLANFVILSARNTDVEEINKRVVELLDSSGERIYTSIDSIVNSD
ncbi:uncharacterized protein, partial [Mycetomoellerius zeteki]|uniref:uncharacterized protein n=1 Tax=Mycetomoellerius zeteki TaxID=64791 RepID=UPI00084EB506